MVLSNWLRQLTSNQSPTRLKGVKRIRRRPTQLVESLERRVLLTVVNFSEAVSGDLDAVASNNTFMVDLGTNVWQGTVETPGDGNDSFSIQVPGTMQVASVRFQYTDGGSDDSAGISSTEGFSHTVSGGSVDVTNNQFDFAPNVPIMSNFDVTVFAGFAFPAAPWTVTIEVELLPVNLPPTANDDVYTSAPNTTLNVAAPGLLDNDNDPEGDTLTVNTTPVSGPANGSLTLNADGSFSYTPNAGTDGNDSFVYEMNDGNGNTDTATVYVAASPINFSEATSGNLTELAGDDVFAVFVGTNVWNGTLETAGDGNDSFTVLIPDNLLVTNVRFQYTDVDPAINANPDSVSISSSAPFSHLLGAQNGRSNVDVSNGDFDTPPPLPIVGGGGFTVTIGAGFAFPAAPWTLTLEVVENSPPVAADDNYAADQDTPLVVAAPGVLSNDSDVDGNSLSASVVSGPSDGTLALSSDGSFTYTPNPGFFGSDSFDYETSDGIGGTDTATVTIVVAAANEDPDATDDAYATDEDTPLVVAAPGVLSNDTDADGDSLTASVVSGPSNGTLVLNGDGSFTYTPNADFNGSDSFVYEADDGNGGTDTATVEITVNALNDPPVANDDGYSTDEDTPLVVAAPGVLGNDTDVEGDALTAAVVSGPSNGTLVLNGDGSFTYTPNADFNGSDSFVYEADDGNGGTDTATVDITVNPVNDAPTAADDGYSTDEDTPLVVAAPGVLSNDTDVDGDSLTASVVSGPSNGTLALNGDGSFTYTPNADFNGSDSFVYEADDGNGGTDTATVNITVNAVNDAPVATDDGYSTDEDTPLVVAAPGVLGNDTDVDGDSLTAAVVSGPSNGTLVLNGDGSFTYTPNADFNGNDSFMYEADDGNGGTDTATVNITIDPVNDAPSFTTLGDQTVPEDSGSHTVPGFATADPGGGADEAGQTFSYNVSNDNPSLFSTAPAIDSSGQLTYTLAPDANGTAVVTVSVTDNGGTANGGVDTSADQTFAVIVLSEEEQIENLQEEIDDLEDDGVLNGGQANSLQSQLGNALAKLERGNTRAAKNQVNAFINHVLGLVSDGVLTQEEGDRLIGLAEDILTSIM